MEHTSKDTLSYLLARCTARIVDGVESGTGFFVGPGYLLTCAHVVAWENSVQKTIKVAWNRQKYSASIEQITDASYPDMALLKVEGITNHPCVYLAEDVQLKDDLYTYGYPKGQTDGDSLISRYIGPTGKPEEMLTLAWSDIRSGLSGSPLLNLRTGAACGLVKRTRGEETLLGGRGVPITRALEAFPILKTLQEQFHTQDGRWANSLTPQQRQTNGLGKLVARSETIELFFSYHAQDEHMLKELLKHLVLLKREKIIDTWYEGELKAGEEQEEQVIQHLNSAQIILLLISSDYIADDKLYDLHVATAMERHKRSQAIVIPIYLRAIDNWKDLPFGKADLVSIPRNRKPLGEAGSKEKDRAFMEVAREIRSVVEGVRKKKG